MDGPVYCFVCDSRDGRFPHFRRRLTSRHRKGRWCTGNAGQTPPTSGDVATLASLCGATFVVCRFGRSSECCVSNRLKFKIDERRFHEKTVKLGSVQTAPLREKFGIIETGCI